MRHCLILNPSSGSADVLQQIEAGCRDWGECTILHMDGSAGPASLARAVDEGCTHIVAAGGDGTINGVINGLVDRLDQVTLGILPLGTGNDLARALAIPLDDPCAAVGILRGGHVRSIDIVRAESAAGVQHFINTAGFGFTAQVGEQVDSGSKEIWGPLAYVFAAARTVSEVSAYPAVVELDGERLEHEIYAMVVANGQTIGGGIPIAPDARLDDGRVDVVLIPAQPVARLAVTLTRLMNGSHADSDGVIYRQAVRIHVVSAGIPFNLDGEAIGDSPVQLTVLPRTLRVLAPEPQETE